MPAAVWHFLITNVSLLITQVRNIGIRIGQQALFLLFTPLSNTYTMAAYQLSPSGIWSGPLNPNTFGSLSPAFSQLMQMSTGPLMLGDVCRICSDFIFL